MSAAEAVALVLLGVCAGFPLWFPAGWVARRGENRELLRQRARRDRQRPRPARPLPAPTPARAQRADQQPAAAVGTGRQEVTR